MQRPILKTVHSAIQAGQLPAIRFHRIYRIPRAAVEAFEARGGYVTADGGEGPPITETEAEPGTRA